MLEVVDILKLNASDPQAAVKTFAPPGQPTVIDCDVLVAGGGVGGVAAAMRIAEQGLKVCLTEETDWLGGQMTAQGVSALDENYLIETSGATQAYQHLRWLIREHYRTNFQLSADAQADPCLNPGKCWVAYLAFEPAVGRKAIENLLAGLIENHSLRVFYRMKPVDATVSGRRIKSVSMVQLDDGSWLEFRARLYLDATELGDLLPLVGAGYTSGAESAAMTGEPHAPEAAQPENVQDFVFPFVVEFQGGQSQASQRPAHFDRFKTAGKFSFLGYKMFAESRRVEADGRVVKLLPFWEYRRLIDCNIFKAGFDHDLSLINWDSNDLRDMNIIDKPAQLVAERLALAKSLSLGFLYWLQTEAPRDDGGFGYNELALRRDVLGSADGLSKYPYIRESRRIRSLTTVVEQDIAAATNAGARARHFPDSVGIAFYPIDIHGHQDVPGAAQATRPFQLPLGALISENRSNLLACAKNIGTTHITNGSFRLHPVEWATGEAAGLLAALALSCRLTPARLWKSATRVRELQDGLAQKGAPLYWYDDVPTSHPAFAAIQFLSATGIVSGAKEHLHFYPDGPLSRGEVAQALFAILAGARRRRLPAGEQSAAAIAFCIDKGLLSPGPYGSFNPDEPFERSQLDKLSLHIMVREAVRDSDAIAGLTGTTAMLTRAEFAMWCYAIARPRKTAGRM